MKPNFKSFGLGSIILFSVLMLTSCMKEESVIPADGSAIDERGPVTTATGTTSGTGGTGSTSNTIVYGLSDQNEIVEFLVGPPVSEVRSTAITGLDSGEVLIAIDIRPSNRQLYALSRSGMLYVVDPMTGVASRISLTPLDPALVGSAVGMDFEPRRGVLRIVTESGQNLSVDANTGRVLSVDQSVMPDFLTVNAIAYANYSNSSFTSQLYDLNTSDGRLYIQQDSKGSAYAIASTGLNIKGEGGFDIGTASRYGWAFLQAQTQSGLNDSTIPGDDTSLPGYRLYSIDTRTGATVSYGPTRAMIGIAVP